MESLVGGPQMVAEDADGGPRLRHIAECRGIGREGVHPGFKPIAKSREWLVRRLAALFDGLEQGVDRAEEFWVGGAAREVEVPDGFFEQRQLFFGGFRGWLDHRNGAYLEE